MRSPAAPPGLVFPSHFKRAQCYKAALFPSTPVCSLRRYSKLLTLHFTQYSNGYINKLLTNNIQSLI